MTFTKEISEQNKRMLVTAREILGTSLRLTPDDFDQMREKYPDVSTDRIRGRLVKALRINRGRR